MNSQLHLRKGREGRIQAFSHSRAGFPAITREVEATLRGSTPSCIRDQTLSDPTKVSQFVCFFNTHLSVLTRPEIVTGPSVSGTPAEPLVVASLGDKIGVPVPVQIPLGFFQGYFTSLVPADVVTEFSLTHHPSDPATFRGPPPGAAATGDDDPDAPVEATEGRLQFPDGRSRLVALPNFLPLAPGQSLPDGINIFDPATYEEAPPLVKIYIAASVYARTHNAGMSVSLGGPLFYLPDLQRDLAPGANPFASLPLTPALAPTPELIPPGTANYQRVLARLEAWSIDTWIHLGSNMTDDPTDPSTPPHGGLPLEHIQALAHAIVTPLIAAKGKKEATTKELEQADSARDVQTMYTLALAAVPPLTDSSTPSTMALPTLNPGFVEVLNKTKPVVAAQSFQDQIRGAIELSLASDKSRDTDVTFHAECITTAFCNAIRSFHWLTEPLVRTNKLAATQRLGLIHFLTPIRGVLLTYRRDEATNGPIVLSHISDDKAQLEASQASKLYSAGRLESGNDVYLAVCNLRLLILSLLDKTQPTPLLLEKLLAYVTVLKSPDGRLFCESHKLNLRVSVYMFQDIQHITGMFFSLAKRPSLKAAAKAGSPIDAQNYFNIARTADAIIDRLRALITGNSLGEWSAAPQCLSWFPVLPMASPTTPGRQRVVPPSLASTPSPAQTPSKASAPKKPRKHDQAKIDLDKSRGILTYDPSVGGARLPHCPVYGKATGAKSEERFCMQFLTTNYYCSRSPCPYPHISAVTKLPPKDSKAFCTWVDKTPGLTFAPGKGPAGTK